MKGTIIPLDPQSSGEQRQLFIVRGDKMFVLWTIGLALAHVMPDYLEARRRVWFPKN